MILSGAGRRGERGRTIESTPERGEREPCHAPTPYDPVNASSPFYPASDFLRAEMG